MLFIINVITTAGQLNIFGRANISGGSDLFDKGKGIKTNFEESGVL